MQWKVCPMTDPTKMADTSTYDATTTRLVLGVAARNSGSPVADTHRCTQMRRARRWDLRHKRTVTHGATTSGPTRRTNQMFHVSL